MNRPTELLQRIPSLVLQGVLLVAGLVFALALLVAGLIAAVGVLLWSLLRGRRPMLSMYWRMFRAARARRPFRAGGMHRGAAPGRRPGGPVVVDAEVVDVEVREIPSTRLPPQR